MRVDAHMHAWNRLHGRIRGLEPVEPVGQGRIRIGGPTGRLVLGMPATLLDCLALGEHALALFDAHGVDAGVLVQEYLDGEQNDYSLELVRRHPQRFFAYALPDFFQPAPAAAAQCMSLLDAGHRGLKWCGGHLAGKARLDDAALLPVWARLERDAGFLAVDFDEGPQQAAELERVLAELPALRVSIGHFGLPTRGGWPAQLDLCRHPGVRMECGGITWLFRDEGWPFASAQRAIAAARDRVGIEKLMWGSDWPRTMLDCTYGQSLDFIARSELLTAREKELFLGENARSFYGLRAPAAPRAALTPITAS